MPGPELCNGVDDNCNGATDEGSAYDAPPWHADADGDADAVCDRDGVRDGVGDAVAQRRVARIGDQRPHDGGAGAPRGGALDCVRRRCG